MTCPECGKPLHTKADHWRCRKCRLKMLGGSPGYPFTPDQKANHQRLEDWAKRNSIPAVLNCLKLIESLHPDILEPKAEHRTHRHTSVDARFGELWEAMTYRTAEE